MEYVRLGKTAFKVSPIRLDCMTYGDKYWQSWVLDEEETTLFPSSHRVGTLAWTLRHPKITSLQSLARPKAITFRKPLPPWTLN